MTSPKKPTSFAFDSPGAAIAAIAAELRPTSVQTISLRRCSGRVLAQPIVADRPSPACDVSAMDGYAVRFEDLPAATMAVAGEVACGSPAPPMPAGRALKIFTGAAVPKGCGAVIPREQLIESPGRIDLPDGLKVMPGQHIRRRGENGIEGETIVSAGSPINAVVASALAAFGVSRPRVYRSVRLGIIVTGNEVREVDSPVQPWQLRDSNSAALTAMFVRLGWIKLRPVVHAPDQPARLAKAIGDELEKADALILTGGVSMGDYDFVPAALEELGCRILFHKLPIRPGKPILGAIGPRGQAILGLPGNPLSVMTTARVFAAPILRRCAGHATLRPAPRWAMLSNPDDQRIGMHWFRPVRCADDGRVELVFSRGSGDLVSAARSDGVVEIVSGQAGPGPWPFYSWSLSDG